MPRRRSTALRVDQLESRLVPASTLTFTDMDGDRVAITATRGDLAGTATFATVGAGQQLQVLDVTGPAFQGAAITTQVTRAPGGDGLVHIGRIAAGGRDLASVTVKGDLGSLGVGDADRATPALGLLKVRSLGRLGLATQGGAGFVAVNVAGRLGALRVAGDIAGASVAADEIGSVTVGGSVLGGSGLGSGRVTAPGGLGPVRIGGDLAGGSGQFSGQVVTATRLASLTVGGSVRGGGGQASGVVASDGAMGPVRIRGDLVGGAGSSSGVVIVEGRLASLTVGGSLRGGAGSASGRVVSGGDLGPVRIRGGLIGGGGQDSGFVRTEGDMGPVAVGGDLAGGAGPSSGLVSAGGRMASLAVGGSVRGGSGLSGGRVLAAGDLGPVVIGGDLAGGAGEDSGAVLAGGRMASLAVGGSVLGGTANRTGRVSAEGDLGPVRIGRDLRGGSITGTQPNLSASGSVEGVGIAGVFVGGSVVSGTDNSTGGDLFRNASIRSQTDIGPVVVKGSLVGNVAVNGLSPVVISAQGRGTPAPGATTDPAIRSLTVGGRVEQAQVLAGFDTDLSPANGNASVGPVTVGGDWVVSTLSAGVGPSIFGTLGTAVINGGADAVVARIASVHIGGVVAGANNQSFRTGFAAEQVGSFRAAGFIAPRTTGTDPEVLLAPFTGNVFLREV